MGVRNSEIILIPWDPESSEHVERLVQQRIACGWNQDLVGEAWRDMQRAGKKTLQWIVLSDSDPARGEKIHKHLKAANPLEAGPIADTAVSFGGEQRKPSPSNLFIPVGHISLDPHNDDPSQSDTYMISSFYVSNALQGSGIGRAAMDAIEKTAISKPLCAKTLTLRTTHNVNISDTEKWVALGRDPPTLSNQDWYQRRGYQAYETREKMWSQTDSQGKAWYFSAVLMRKDIQ